MVCAGGGYAIYVNGEFDHLFPGKNRAQSCFEYLRDMLPDTETVDLVDLFTGEVLASTIDWKHED